MKNNNSDSDFKDLQFVDLRLQNGQVELILRAMELYGYNLKFMVNDTDITTFINGIEDYLNERSYYIQLCNINDSESLKNGIRWLYENIKSNLIY